MGNMSTVYTECSYSSAVRYTSDRMIILVDAALLKGTVHVHISRGGGGGTAPLTPNHSTRWREWIARERLGVLKNLKCSCCCQNLNPGSLCPQPIAVMTQFSLRMTNGEKLSNIMSCAGTTAYTVMRELVVCRPIVHCRSILCTMFQHCSTAAVFWHVIHHCWICGSKHCQECGACIFRVQGSPRKNGTFYFWNTRNTLSDLKRPEYWATLSYTAVQTLNPV
jgi:hypothetical protein